jgi:membrane dipeptidase
MTKRTRKPLTPARRQVLWGTVTSVLAPVTSAKAQAARRPVPRPAAPLIINALGGLGDPNLGINRPQAPGVNALEDLDINARAIRDAHASGVTAINCTLGYVAGPQEPFEATVRAIGQWEAAIRDHPRDLMKVCSAADVLRARAERKIGLIWGFQNAVQLGEKVERVDIFADLGVRVFQLTYNPANPLGDGSMAPGNRGLTPWGHKVIERLNARRCMVDLSHSGQRICLDAARASRQPISINHTGCRALTDLPRNKTDEELRLVAQRGGFVGIYFMPFLRLDGKARAEDVVAHIEHAVNVCGEDHVGIGTDGGVTAIDDLHAYDVALAREHEERVRQGVAAKGESATTYPFVVDLRGPDQFRKLAEMLRKRGHPQARVDKIMGRNFLRYAQEVWGA